MRHGPGDRQDMQVIRWLVAGMVVCVALYVALFLYTGTIHDLPECK